MFLLDYQNNYVKT